MSANAFRWACTQRGLLPRDHLVLRALAYAHFPDRTLYLNQTTIAARCDMSLSSVKRSLRHLAKVGLLKTIRVYVHGLTKNAYVLQFDVVLTGPKREEAAPSARTARAKCTVTQPHAHDMKSTIPVTEALMKRLTNWGEGTE